MSKFTAKLKTWFKNRPTKRRLIQIYTALLYNANIKGYIKGDIFKGNSKYVCVPGMNCYSCPGAVAACPLGSLQNAFASSGNSSAYYIFGILAIFGLMLGRTICGFLCPVGLGQELLYKIKTPKLAKSRATRILSYLKYVILVMMVVAIPVMYSMQGIAVPAFCKYICPAGTLGGGLGLLINPVNWQGSTNLLEMLGPIFTWKFALLVVLLVASVLVFRPFCRFLCPLGAIYGLFNKFALFGIKVNEDKCTHCGLCVQHCKMDVRHVGDHECINCGECKAVCPTHAISWKCGKLFGEEQPSAQPAPALQAAAALHPEGAACTSSCATCSARCSSFTSTVATTTASASATTIATAAPNDTKATNGKLLGTKYGRSFWVQVVAWTIALLLLAGALLYCNVFNQTSGVGHEVGDIAPDFALRLYGEDSNGAYALLQNTFCLSEHSGEVTVINFWATWCGPCVAEIPGFNNVARDYPQINVLGVHENVTEDVAAYIVKETPTKESWQSYSMLFVLDDSDGTNGRTFADYGGRSALPMTVIVGKDGRICYVRNGSFPEEDLRAEVEKALNA